MNKNLTAQNEQAVQTLLKNQDARFLWQVTASLRSKTFADKKIAEKYGCSIKTVKAARYYW